MSNDDGVVPHEEEEKKKERDKENGKNFPLKDLSIENPSYSSWIIVEKDDKVSSNAAESLTEHNNRNDNNEDENEDDNEDDNENDNDNEDENGDNDDDDSNKKENDGENVKSPHKEIPSSSSSSLAKSLESTHDTNCLKPEKKATATTTTTTTTNAGTVILPNEPKQDENDISLNCEETKKPRNTDNNNNNNNSNGSNDDNKNLKSFRHVWVPLIMILLSFVLFYVGRLYYSIVQEAANFDPIAILELSTNEDIIQSLSPELSAKTMNLPITNTTILKIIRKSYRRLSLRYHYERPLPGMNWQEQEEIFQTISFAYEALTDDSGGDDDGGGGGGGGGGIFNFQKYGHPGGSPWKRCSIQLKQNYWRWKYTILEYITSTTFIFWNTCILICICTAFMLRSNWYWMLVDANRKNILSSTDTTA